MSAAVRYAVKCDDFTTSPCRTRESAEHVLESITALGECEHEHEVVEVDDA